MKKPPEGGFWGFGTLWVPRRPIRTWRGDAPSDGQRHQHDVRACHASFRTHGCGCHGVDPGSRRRRPWPIRRGLRRPRHGLRRCSHADRSDEGIPRLARCVHWPVRDGVSAQPSQGWGCTWRAGDQPSSWMRQAAPPEPCCDGRRLGKQSSSGEQGRLEPDSWTPDPSARRASGSGSRPRIPAASGRQDLPPPDALRGWRSPSWVADPCRRRTIRKGFGCRRYQRNYDDSLVWSPVLASFQTRAALDKSITTNILYLINTYSQYNSIVKYSISMIIYVWKK